MGLQDFDRKELFKQLYEEFADRIYHYVLLMVRNRSDAEELMQEIFVKVYRKLE